MACLKRRDPKMVFAIWFTFNTNQKGDPKKTTCPLARALRAPARRSITREDGQGPHPGPKEAPRQNIPGRFPAIPLGLGRDARLVELTRSTSLLSPEKATLRVHHTCLANVQIRGQHKMFTRRGYAFGSMEAIRPFGALCWEMQRPPTV